VPELPEVEVVRAGLAPAVTGATVTSVEVFDERSLRRHDGPSEDFIHRLVGARFEAPQRRGKFLWIPVVGPALDAPASEMTEKRGALPRNSGSAPFVSSTTPSFRKGWALVVHLGMSGQVLLRAPGSEDLRTRIRLDLDNNHRINFVDQRIFGSMALDELVPTDHGETVPHSVAHIGRDPLDPHFDERAFFAKLAKRNTGIKRALLDQGLASGIGNIYADEALWMSRIHYEQPTATLTLPRKRLLLDEVRRVFRQALAEGGTSFDEQYKNVNGTSGYFERSLKVYGQQGEPCQRCGRMIVREQFMNRGSHFCPFCQKAPRTTL
jgi:formamidopyrimidine-DNA glycosylase